MKKIPLFIISLIVIFATASLPLSFAQAQPSTTQPQPTSAKTNATQPVTAQKIKEVLKNKRDAQKLAIKNKREKAKQLQLARKNNQKKAIQDSSLKKDSSLNKSTIQTNAKLDQPVSQTKATYQPTKTVVPQVTELNTTPAVLSENSTDDSIVKLSAGLSLSYEQQAEVAEDGTQAKGLGFEVTPKLTIGDYSVSARVVYAYNTVEPKTSEFADGLISAGYKGWHLFPSLKLAPNFSVELPFSKESRENRGIIYVANAGLRLSLDTKYLDIEKYALSYSVSYGHFSNEFTTRENGDPAVKYKIVQTVSTSYDFDPITLSLLLQFGSNYSYEDVVRNGFLHVESISFKHTESLSYSLYHYNTGPLLKGTNYENNLKAYDKDSSIVGASIDLSI